MLDVPFVRVFALRVRSGVFDAARKIEGSALDLPPKGRAPYALTLFSCVLDSNQILAWHDT